MKAALAALDTGDYECPPDVDTLVSVYNALKTAYDAGYSKGHEDGTLAQIVYGKKEPDEAALATMILRGQLQDDDFDDGDDFSDLDKPAKVNANVEGAPWPKDEDDDTAD